MFGTYFPEHPFHLLVVFTFVCFSFLALGLVIAMLADNVPAVQALGQAVFLPMIMIGGVGVPLWQLPHWAQIVAGFFPGRYAVEALQACQRGPGISAGRFDLLSLTIIGLASILAGAKLFRWDVGQKISGPAKAWVALAVAAWAFVGITATSTGRLKAAVAPRDDTGGLVATLNSSTTEPSTAPVAIATTAPVGISTQPASAPSCRATGRRQSP